MDFMDGMVLIGHRSSESTSGASKTEKFCNSTFRVFTTSAWQRHPVLNGSPRCFFYQLDPGFDPMENDHVFKL